MNLALSHPVDGLVSYHFFRSEEAMQAVTSPGLFRLIGDSGAFSAYSQGAEISVAEYAEWITRWRDHLLWAAALDVLGDPRATRRNWEKLRDLGALTVPTIHMGTDPRWLDPYVKEGCDFFGLGGIVGAVGNPVRWMLHVLRYARERHPHVRFHGWGATQTQVLMNLPIYSADSTGLVASATKYGLMKLWDPRAHKRVPIRFDGRAAYHHGDLLRGVYGVAPAEVARSDASNRTLITKLLVASTQRYGDYLVARHKVSSPAYAFHPSIPADPGIRLHVVLSKDDFERTAGTYAPKRSTDSVRR